MMKRQYLLILFLIISATISAQDLTINEALFDPTDGIAGDANGDGTRDFADDEFLEIVNTSGAALDISGYKIYDANRFALLPGTDNPRHIVPAMTPAIPAGGIYIVFGGVEPGETISVAITGLPNVTVHTASSGQLNMTNSSETMTITDASGTVITTVSPDEDGIDVSSRIEQSIARVPVLTGPFVIHTRLNDDKFSPGVLSTFTPDFLILNEFLADPETGVDDPNNDGDPNTNDDEFLEFVNNSGASKDIAGYKLYDITDLGNNLTSHVFPVGSVIPDGGVLVLFDDGSPKGTFGDAIVQTCDGASVNGFTLTNGGQTIFVTNASDRIVFAQSYTGTSSDNQSQTRSPDITGNFVLHTTLPGSAKFSPGRKIDGTTFIARNEFNVASGDWNVGGNWTLGLPTGTSNVEIPAGRTVTITSDNEVANNLEVKGTLEINSTKSLTVNGDFETSGTATINSGGSFIVSETSLGNISYKRTLTKDADLTNAWYSVSTPVSGETVANLRANNNFAPGSGGSRIGLATYKNDGSAWNYFTTGSADAISSGTGLTAKLNNAIAGNDLTFTGTYTSGNIESTISQATNNFNFVGNPYTAYMNLGTFFTNNNAANTFSETTIWIWDENKNGVNMGGYVQKMSGTDAAFEIAPGQGFFVSAGTADPNKVTFNANNQSHKSTDSFLKSAARPEVHLNLFQDGLQHQTKLYYIEGTTTDFDNGYDGSMFGGISYNLAVYSELVSNNQGKKLGIQSLPNSNFDNMIVPIGVEAKADKEISFSTESLNLPSNIKVYLEDRQTNTFTRLDEANSNYTITLTENSNGIGRFYLHTKSTLLGTNDISLKNISIYKTNNSTVRITGLSQGKSTLKLFNILGKQIIHKSFTSKGVQDIELPTLATGVYIVQLETETGRLNKKITLE